MGMEDILQPKDCRNTLGSHVANHSSKLARQLRSVFFCCTLYEWPGILSQRDGIFIGM